MAKIILGSRSKGRRRILINMGLSFEVIAADIDEKAIRCSDPKQLTLALANAKADALMPRLSNDGLLITSDQVVVCHGIIREKPENEREAYAYLRSYSDGYPAVTVTSVAVTNLASRKRCTGTDIAQIWFNHIPDQVISDYIASGDAFEQAGSFSSEHPLLEPHVARIEGEPESIIGLPRALTLDLLEQAR